MELAPYFITKFFDDNGEPLAGGLLYTYEAGTSTPKTTYIDRAGTIENTNPIVLDANGECDLRLDIGSYKFVLHDADDVLLREKDDISASDDSGLSYAFYRDVIYIDNTNSPYYITQDDNGKLISCNATAGEVIVVLPQISVVALPFNVAIKKTFGSNNVTIDRTGTDTIDGQSTNDPLVCSNSCAESTHDRAVSKIIIRNVPVFYSPGCSCAE